MRSPLGDIDIPTSSGLGQVLLDRIQDLCHAGQGNRTAMIDGSTGTVTTYQQLQDHVHNLTSSLQKLGLVRDSVVLVCCPNCVEFPVIFLAVVYLGGIVCPVNPASSIIELQRQMQDTDPRYIFTVTGSPLANIQAALQTCPSYERISATFLYIVPPIALSLAKSPLVGGYDVSSVTSIFSGAAPLGKDICEEIRNRFHITDVRQGYGMTETSPAALHPPLGHTKHGSVGIPLPNTQVQVVDPVSQKPLGPGSPGEIWIRGPQVMLGYLRKLSATREILDGHGWLHTGDIGFYDVEGYFFIVDRIKELIKYKGFQVPPAELEAVVLAHPAVSDVAVIGIPDTACGELPRAYVVPKEGHTVTSAQIQRHVADQVVFYKQLSGGVEFVKHIPKSPSGKILRRILRQQATKSTTSKL